MSLNKDYEHLTNGDVAEHLAGHRLVQEGQRQKRFEGVRLPFGKQLIDLVRERLVALKSDAAAEPVTVEKIVEVPGPEVCVEVPGPERIVEVPAAGPTDEDLVALYNGITSLEDLELKLSAERGEEVLLALVGLTDRLRASVIASQAPVEKVAEPTPEAPAE